jgi:PAS domain S-box-containing protein
VSAFPSASERVNILVVDDRPENLTALAAILDDPSYNVLSASSGPEALKRLLVSDVAVILLDVRMPEMDGFETARVIRERDRTSAVPIIFLTADGHDMRLVDEAYAAGAVDYMVKPLDPNVVRAKVAVFVELHRKAEQIKSKEEELREIERRRSALALAESEVLYETTFQSAAIGIAHLSRDGRWLRVNPRFAEITGVPREQLVTMRLADVAVAEDQPALSEQIAEVFRRAGGPGAVVDCRFRHRGGADVWVKLTLSLLRDAAGSPKHVIVTADDVTERRRAAEAQRFLAEASELLIGSRDHTAALAAVARLAVPRIADLCIAEIAGEAAPLAVAHQDANVARELEDSWRPLVATSQAPREPRLCLDLAGDPELGRLAAHGLASGMIVPLVARGRLLGTMTFAAGAQRRPYTAADLELAEDLAHRAALAVDNARLFAQAQDAIRVRDEFLSIASHELRTPLTPLQLQLQRLLGARHKSLIESMPVDKLKSVLARCARQVERLAGLIDDLLDVSRISSGRLRLEIDGPVDLGELVRDVVNRHTEELSRAACPLVVESPEDPVVGTWDRRRLEQVVENLVSNAIKYGAGTAIQIAVADGVDQAVLRVKDQGIGIPPEKLDKVFDRFERAVSARAYGGLGLGLYITRQIVEAHRGSIRVESEAGRGATFTVELPKLPQTAGAHVVARP